MHGMRRSSISIARLPATPTISASGEIAKDFTTVAAAIAATIWPSRGNAPQRDYGRPALMMHFAMLARGTDVRVGDRVVNGADRYLVLFVADYGHHIEVEMERVPLP